MADEWHIVILHQPFAQLQLLRKPDVVLIAPGDDIGVRVFGRKPEVFIAAYTWTLEQLDVEWRVPSKLLSDFDRTVGRAIIGNDQPLWEPSLGRNASQLSLDPPFAVERRHDDSNTRHRPSPPVNMAW
jgi:hypothetical protein